MSTVNSTARKRLSLSICASYRLKFSEIDKRLLIVTAVSGSNRLAENEGFSSRLRPPWWRALRSSILPPKTELFD